MTSVMTACGRAAWRCSIVCVFLALLSVGAVSAQTAQPAAPTQAPAANERTPQQADLPSPRSIIDRHIKAIGGRGAILAHKSTHAAGTFSMPATGISGALDVYGAAPDKTLVKINLGGVGDLVEGFDGTHGWMLQPMTGPMLKQGKELAEQKFAADYYSDLKEPDRYTSMKTIEKTTFEGRPCYKVSLVRKDGVEHIEYYDVETGLKAGSSGTRETPMGAITATQTLSDYKSFGGVLLPTTMKQAAMGVEQVMKVTSVEFDNVPPSTFEPPAQIKALIK
jgi:zinc protease